MLSNKGIAEYRHFENHARALQEGVESYGTVVGKDKKSM